VDGETCTQKNVGQVSRPRRHSGSGRGRACRRSKSRSTIGPQRDHSTASLQKDLGTGQRAGRSIPGGTAPASCRRKRGQEKHDPERESTQTRHRKKLGEVVGPRRNLREDARLTRQRIAPRRNATKLDESEALSKPIEGPDQGAPRRSEGRRKSPVTIKAKTGGAPGGEASHKLARAVYAEGKLLRRRQGLGRG